MPDAAPIDTNDLIPVTAEEWLTDFADEHITGSTTDAEIAAITTEMQQEAATCWSSYITGLPEHLTAIRDGRRPAPRHRTIASRWALDEWAEPANGLPKRRFSEAIDR